MSEERVTQRLAALEVANEVRAFRSQLKSAIRQGDAMAWEVFASSDRRVASMRVWDLLCAIPGVGRATALRALEVACLSPYRRVSDVTPRQWAVLRSMVRGISTPRGVIADTCSESRALRAEARQARLFSEERRQARRSQS